MINVTSTSLSEAEGACPELAEGLDARQTCLNPLQVSPGALAADSQSFDFPQPPMSPRSCLPRMDVAVFIDRDGVICRNRNNHVKSWEEFTFLPGALEALARLAHSDLYIIIITNQAIINRNYVPAEVVENIHARMVQAIEVAGGRVDRVMYCPHRPEEHCTCRKPQPGMLTAAAEELGLDLSRSYLIGDAEADMQAGRAAGCHRYLVLTGRGRRQLIRCWLHGERGFAVMPNLGKAVNTILHRENNVSTSTSTSLSPSDMDAETCFGPAEGNRHLHHPERSRRSLP